MSLEDGRATPFDDMVSIDPIGSVFSPDGRWLAYRVRAAGADALSSSNGVFIELLIGVE